jgi:hypothetical protein
LPLLGDNDRSADRAYSQQFPLEDDRESGKPHHLQYAERFYYVDRRRSLRSNADKYIEENAVPL